MTEKTPQPKTEQEKKAALLAVQKMAGPNDLVTQDESGEVFVMKDGKLDNKDKKQEMMATDMTDAQLEKMARGFIMGTASHSRRKDIRVDLEEKVIKRIGRKGKVLTDRLFELIDGVYVVDKVGGKEVRYYKVPPSLPAIIYALDRVLGKPTQNIDRKDEKKGIVVVEHIIKNLASPRKVEATDVTPDVVVHEQ